MQTIGAHPYTATSIVENPERTAAYHALVEQRRGEIRDFFDRYLPEQASIVWEVGCGHGHFLSAYALAHPDRQCVGVDISSDRIARAERKRARAGLPNLHFLQAEARLFLQEMPAAVSVAETFILFPDPWPKLRHQKHRILQPAFLSQLASRTSAASRLYFRTDFHPYYREAAAVLESHQEWRPVRAAWPFEFETVFQQRAPAHYSVVAQRVP